MTITSIQLNEEERINYPAYHFGDNFPFRIEPSIYNMARNLSGDYAGGLWQFYELSNGGFFMAPDSDTHFHVVSQKGYQGNMSAMAFGVTTCLFAYSHLSFCEELSDVCSEQFHLLREFALLQSEVREICSAID